MQNKILFISWDSPQTNYLESLFFPVFSGMQQEGSWLIHVVQFSWAENGKHKHIAELAKGEGIIYSHFSIKRKPTPLLGTLYTLVRGLSYLKRYVQQQEIEIIMPRSIFPALMAKGVKKKFPELKIVFDADGLPLEERVDFSGLNPMGLQYRYLKRQETHLLKMADLVLTRSEKATQLHLKNIGRCFSSKFFKVSNGRDKSLFKPDKTQRYSFRKKLGLSPDQLLVVYCGSLGPQYGWDSMVVLFRTLLQAQPNSIFLILTPADAYLKNRVPHDIKQQLRIIKGPFADIPSWLNAADMAFAIREPRFSMQGVAPIKLGEYLLMGLPTVASKGIGDTGELLKGQPFVHLFDHQKKGELENFMLWVGHQGFSKKKTIREFAIQHFTLERSIKDYKLALNYLRPKV